MKIFLSLTLSLSLSLAAPVAWTPELAALFTEISRDVVKARSNGVPSLLSCDLSKVSITQYLGTIPDAPPVEDPGNNKLLLVTVGRGIQNYTCADSQATTKPKAIGAIANLYDVSCLAANNQNLLSLTTPTAVQYNTTYDNSGVFVALNLPRIGHHYFNSAGSPEFDLTDDKSRQLGVLVANGKTPAMKVDAPQSAVKGQTLSANGQTGAVPWLKLNKQDGTTSTLTEVYRVVTAGGLPPSSCSGQPSLISVQYAAQYWFYRSQ